MTQLLPESILNQFKYEIAQELGIDTSIKNRGWSEISSKDCGRIGGRIGGRMVKVMIREAEKTFNN